MSDTAIAAAPIVSALSPLVNAAASGLVIGLGGLLFALLARLTGIAFAPDAQARLEKAADAEVHALIAGAENNLATGKFSLGNPLVTTRSGRARSQRAGNRRQARPQRRRGPERGREGDRPGAEGDDRFSRIPAWKGGRLTSPSARPSARVSLTAAIHEEIHMSGLGSFFNSLSSALTANNVAAAATAASALQSALGTSQAVNAQAQGF